MSTQEQPPKPMGQKQAALPAHEVKPEELQEQLADLLGEVWAAEENWRLDDRIDVLAKNEGWS